MKLQRWVVLFCLCGPALQVLAHEVEEPKKGPWSGTFSLGYLASTGNTDDSSATAEFTTAYDLNVWHHMLRGRSFSASKDNQSTSESYQLGWKTKYDLSTYNYLFGALDWNKDRFSSFTRQTFATAGYGRRILNSERFILNAELGAGYSKQRAIISETEFETLKENQDGSLVRVGGNFIWNISENAAFDQTLAVFITDDNTFTESVSRLTADLIGDLALELSYTVKNNSDVAPGLDKTDTYTAVSIRYTF